MREHPEEVRTLLNALTTQRAALANRLAQHLNAFAPPGLILHAKLVVVPGSHQNGWVDHGLGYRAAEAIKTAVSALANRQANRSTLSIESPV